MGMITETNIITQLKKAQGETNDRLERIAQLLEEQNRWLAALHTATRQPA